MTTPIENSALPFTFEGIPERFEIRRGHHIHSAAFSLRNDSPQPVTALVTDARYHANNGQFALQDVVLKEPDDLTLLPGLALTVASGETRTFRVAFKEVLLKQPEPHFFVAILLDIDIAGMTFVAHSTLTFTVK